MWRGAVAQSFLFITMKTKNIYLIGLACCIGLCSILSFPPFAVADDEEAVLMVGERLFKSLKARQFRGAWEVLSKESQESIVTDTLRSIEKERPGSVTREQVTNDFAQGTGFAVLYWEGFLQVFDPDKVLERSRWSVGSLKADEAEIVIHYKRAQRPARIKVVKEGGQWRVGLAETFWKK